MTMQMNQALRLGVTTNQQHADAGTSTSAVTSAVEDEYFEISDYTASTSWEKFINELEEHIRYIDKLLHDIYQNQSNTPHTLQSSSSSQCGCVNNVFQTGMQLYDLQYQLNAYLAADYQPAQQHICSYYNTVQSSSSTTQPSSSHTLPCCPYLPTRVSHTLPSQHHLVQQLGVTSFIILSPAETRDISRNEASTLLSALSIASNNCESPIPTFVYVDDMLDNKHWGRTSFHSNIRFDVKRSTRTPSSLQHLSGITELFTDSIRKLQSRVSLANDMPIPPVNISLSYTYIKNTSSKHDYTMLPNAIIWRDISEDDAFLYGATWGSTLDPISSIALRTSFPFFRESTFVDNAVYTDIDSNNAPDWQLQVKYRANNTMHTDTQLTAALQEFQQVVKHASRLPALSNALTLNKSSLQINNHTHGTPSLTVNDIEASDVKSVRGQRRKRLLDALQSLASTEVRVPLASSTAIKAVQNRVKSTVDNLSKQLETVVLTAELGAVPTADHIDNVMRQLFNEDAAENTDSKQDHDRAGAELPVNRYNPLPYGSLLSRFVFQLFRLNDTEMLNARSLALLWSELVNELRYHWESGLDIPYLLSSDTPNHDYCLLHQKLQLLQLCIRLSRERLKRQANASARGGTGNNVFDTVDWSTLEFDEDWNIIDNNSHLQSQNNINANVDFNAHNTSATPAANGWGELDIELDEGNVTKSPANKAANNANLSSNDVAAAGWDHELNELDVHDSITTPSTVATTATEESSSSTSPSLKLLMTDEAMNIPVTQEAVVMTSDAFHEHNVMLEAQGSSSEGSKLRAEMHAKQLLSDMSSFKAANANAIFEDFVRWHSPRDWTAGSKEGSNDSNNKGELSQRMRDPSALWRQLWKAAPSLHAHEQEPLFDFNVEAERILHYFETISPASLLQQLNSIALFNVIQAFSRIPTIQQSKRVRDAIQHLQPYVHQQEVTHNILEELSDVERLCARAASLSSRVPSESYSELADGLLNNSFTHLTTASQRHHVACLFATIKQPVGDASEDKRQNESQRSYNLPKADVSEYTLFAPCNTLDTASFPELMNTPQPQCMSNHGHRMYVLRSKNEFRIATSFVNPPIL